MSDTETQNPAGDSEPEVTDAEPENNDEEIEKEAEEDATSPHSADGADVASKNSSRPASTSSKGPRISVDISHSGTPLTGATSPGTDKASPVAQIPALVVASPVPSTPDAPAPLETTEPIPEAQEAATTAPPENEAPQAESSEETDKQGQETQDEDKKKEEVPEWKIVMKMTAEELMTYLNEQRKKALKEAQKEDKENTFAPKLTPNPTHDSDARKEKDIYTRLVEDGHHLRDKIHKKRDAEHAAKEKAFSDLKFQPTIQHHPVHEKDTVKGRPVHERLVEDVQRRRTKHPHLVSPRAKGAKSPEALPSDAQLVDIVQEQLNQADVPWILDHAGDADELARSLWERLIPNGVKQMQRPHCKAILDCVARTLDLALSKREFNAWYDAAEDDHGLIEKKSFIFLLRTLLHTCPYHPQQPYQTYQRGRITPTKAVSPSRGSPVRPLPPEGKPESYTTVLWGVCTYGLDIRVDIDAGTFTVSNCAQLGKAYLPFDRVTGVIGPLSVPHPPIANFTDVPDASTLYCYAHPPPYTFPAALSVLHRKDPRHAFLMYGGFLFIDEQRSVVAVVALSPHSGLKHSQRLFLAPAQGVTPAFVAETTAQVNAHAATCAAFSEFPGVTATMDSAAPYSFADPLRSTWLVPSEEATGVARFFKQPRAPHGGFLSISGGVGVYCAVLCHRQKCCGGRWDVTRGTVPAHAVSVDPGDVITNLVQWADLPALLNDTNAFYLYCHALYRNCSGDTDGNLERERFRDTMDRLKLALNVDVPEARVELNAASSMSSSSLANITAMLTSGTSQTTPLVTEREFIAALRSLLLAKSMVQARQSQAPKRSQQGRSTIGVLPKIDVRLIVEPERNRYVLDRSGLDYIGEYFGWNLVGWLAAPHGVPASHRKLLSLPIEAAQCAFAYPVPHLRQVLDMTNPAHLFLAYGGFVYLDSKRRVLQVATLTPEEQGVQILLAGPTSAAVSPAFQKDRFRPTSFPFLGHNTACFFAWLAPSEPFGKSKLPHGGFVVSLSRPEQEELTEGTLHVAICTNTACCGPHWQPTALELIKQLRPTLLANDLELFLKCHDLFELLRDKDDEEETETIPSETFTLALNELAKALDVAAPSPDETDKWIQGSATEGRYVTEESFFSAVQHVLQRHAKRAAGQEAAAKPPAKESAPRKADASVRSGNAGKAPRRTTSDVDNQKAAAQSPVLPPPSVAPAPPVAAPKASSGPPPVGLPVPVPPPSPRSAAPVGTPPGVIHAAAPPQQTNSQQTEATRSPPYAPRPPPQRGSPVGVPNVPKTSTHESLRKRGTLWVTRDVPMRLTVDIGRGIYTFWDDQMGPVQGALSPLCQVTSTGKQALRKPGKMDAEYYAFAYPSSVAAFLREVREPRSAFLALGGFVYVDANQEVLQVDVLSPDGGIPTSQKLSFSEPKPLPDESVVKLFTQMRLHPIDPQSNGGAELFAWLLPGEAWDNPTLPHGGFAYIWGNLTDLMGKVEDTWRGSPVNTTRSMLGFSGHALYCRVVCHLPSCCGEFARVPSAPREEVRLPHISASTNGGRAAAGPAPRPPPRVAQPEQPTYSSAAASAFLQNPSAYVSLYASQY
eukprot:TRINITY_DN19737_c0_g1_i1.p1 TRINITY_DN19737_c0_g1~~TRINITY_DN19737_c0_g1_i1.p1  ORF type:complete len:1582 (+),score=213.10 TRINITY_DN19737_c0_g1_i1:63-4808(+)